MVISMLLKNINLDIAENELQLWDHLVVVNQLISKR